jgi:putative intracellular protease/amidase
LIDVVRGIRSFRKFDQQTKHIEEMSNNNKTILFVLTNTEKLGDTGRQTGFYLPEAAHPYEVFTNSGYNVDFVTPKGGKAPVDEKSVELFSNDKACKDFMNNESVQKRVQETLKPSDIDLNKYSTIFYVGGHGPLYDVPDNAELAKLAADLYEKHNGVVSAVCHGPCGLLNIKLSNGDYLIKNKTVAGFTNEEETAVQLEKVVPFLLEDELKKRGAIFEHVAPWQPFVRTDGRLVTGQNPASATPIAEAIINVLTSKQ